MATFKTIESIYQFIEKSVEDTLRSDVAKDSVDIYKKHKQEDFYDMRTPEQYIRTYQFLNSTISQYEDRQSKKNKKVLSVFTDTSSNFNDLGHPSITTGKDMSKNLPVWLNYGTSNSTIYNHVPSYYHDKALIEIDEKLKYMFINGLQKRGIGSY